MNDKDIEKYLTLLEDGWLSNDDLEVSDQEEENDLENHNREQVLHIMLQSNEEYTESPQNPESDPPITESEEINIQVQSMRVPTGHMFPGLLDKRKLIWKKPNMKFDKSKITFQGDFRKSIAMAARRALDYSQIEKILENSDDEIPSERGSDSEVEDDLNKDDVQSDTENKLIDEVAAEIIE
ncbi:unnamed protein product [Danaus chrysippus]|uniref:(African queen) hypothetical protein n=1 Tax=Danaus chrysippus TaxID=151541 RepID=A0A8J2RAV5_9NEOP|nr:unnamed protein product [Danaus chrysippus]